MFDWFKNLWRQAFTPPAPVSTDALMDATELEIDEVPRPLARARSWLGKGRYCLGAGCKSPTADAPWTRCAKPKEHGHGSLGNVFSDCSGMVCAAHEIPRYDAALKVWVNTDEMERRGKAQGIAWKDAQPGDVVVYGAGKAIGHCGIVSTVDDAGPHTVIHCQASKRPAVREDDAEMFARKKAVIWRPR